MGLHRQRSVLAGGLCAVVLHTASPARAGLELASGWDGDARQGNGSVSAGWSFDRAGRTFVLRSSGSLLHYRYFEDGEEARVSSAGGTLDLVTHLRSGNVDFTAGPGIELVRDRTVFASGEIFREWRVGPTLAVGADAPIDSSLDVALSASYSHASRYSWLRTALFQDMPEIRAGALTGLAVGVEFTGQGDRDLSIYQVGPVFELRFPGGCGAQVRGGYSLFRFAGDRDRPGGYLGAELSWEPFAPEPD